MFSIIIFDGMIKHGFYLDIPDSKKTYITRYLRQGLNGEQIVVEDIVYRTGKSGKNVGQAYRIAVKYSDKLVFDEKKYVLLVNGSSEHDMGISLYILSNIFRNIDKPEIILIVMVPPRSASTYLKASFYAWFKTISLYDVMFNYKTRNSFKYILLNPDLPSQLINYLIELFNNVQNNCSLLHIRLKKFIVPVKEIFVFAELLKYRGFIEHIIKEYRYILMLLHGILDKAPTELWSIARKEKHVIEGSKYIIEKYIKNKENIDQNISELLRILLKGRKYTVSIIDPKVLFDEFLRGTGVSKIYRKIKIKDKIMILENISTHDLTSIYDFGVVDNIKNLTRYLIVTRDLAEYIERENVIIKKHGMGEIGIVDVMETPINFDCKVNNEYLPFDFQEAYYERAGIALPHLYPPEIRVGDKILKPQDLHIINPVNYYGYIDYVGKECSINTDNILNQLLSQFS